MARILFGAASEVDVVSKRLCQKLDPNSKADNITKYKSEILATYPRLVSAIVKIPRFGLTLEPWTQWNTDPSPLWWRAYNNVKHKRHTHFSEASLQHTLNAVAGLFVILLFYYQQEGGNGQLNPDPVIFRIGPPFNVDRLMWGEGPGTNVYHLRPNDDG